MVNAIRDFLRQESTSGILLFFAMLLAMAAENSPAKPYYDALMETPVEIRAGHFGIAKPLLLWVNDGLMAVFFFLIGLEIKREVLEGELSRPDQVILPAIAAVGGMTAPALIYVSINWGDARALTGWAIPSATDIAFALGVLSLLGDRAPSSLKTFLLTLAIIDDLGAIIIIALFYSGQIYTGSIFVAVAALFALFYLNRRGVTKIAPYIVIGVILWVAVLKSGVHATLAGVVLAFFIPMRGDDGVESPLKLLEHDLHPTVAYAILPFFAFANSGVSLQGIGLSSLLEPVPLGIAAGLFIGNQVGVFGASWVSIRLGIARLPNQSSWLDLYGVAALCGIGFTMSLFIGSLAFEQGGPDFAVDDRLGILAGSVASAILGYSILRYSASRKKAET